MQDEIVERDVLGDDVAIGVFDGDDAAGDRAAPVRVVGREGFGVEVAGLGDGVFGAARLDLAERVMRHVPELI